MAIPLNTQILAELGWYGTCFDGNSSDLKLPKKKYFTSRRLDLNRTEFVQSWITCENINGLIEQYAPDSIDVLSIDLDGMDYWILEALKKTPNNYLRIQREFWSERREDSAMTALFTVGVRDILSEVGTTEHLCAYTKMLRKKGYRYRLVYCESNGVNAFFVKEGTISATDLATRTVANAFNEDWRRAKELSLSEQIGHLSEYPTVSV